MDEPAQRDTLYKPADEYLSQWRQKEKKTACSNKVGDWFVCVP
jgi:hypothetical protein